MRPSSETRFLPTAPEASPATLYAFDIGFDRLVPGVDNLRFDVYLSPGLRAVTKQVVRISMAKHAQSEDILNIKNTFSAVKDRDEFKRIYSEVLQGAIHLAKSHEEVQIDFLAQTAVFKLVLEMIQDQHIEIVENYQRKILMGERAGPKDIKATVRLKERLGALRENKSGIIRQSGMEIFQYILEVHLETLVPLRTANFGKEGLFPKDVFINPLLHVTHPPNDDIMLEKYMLLGRRLEDPDRYDTLLSMIKELAQKAIANKGGGPLEDDDLDPWLKNVDNISQLVNAPLTLKAYKRIKKAGGPREERKRLKTLWREQKRCLRFFYRRYSHTGLIKRICAAYEIASIYAAYCPPLQPRQVLQFITARKSRRLISGRLKSYQKVYRKKLSVGPLRQKSRALRRISKSKQKSTLIRFLTDFARFHRDLENHHILSEAMGRIHLTENPKTLLLSRANKTLFEFLLPHEKSPEEKPIIHHVVIKADVRGATDLTHRMIERRLNPASFFSLNFFEPISDILPNYGASKVFIEGDAVILSILEREAEPSEWYAVARACGLAIQMLMIINRYNTRSKQNKLPVLEVGCGISYLGRPPAFLFDGDSRIMISPAINFADRMSGCSRTLRGRKGMKIGPFHLRVFQTVAPKEQAKTRDDLCVRYNVNGIELNAAGFKKLSKEINLKAINYVSPEPKKIKATLYTGKFPTVTGRYQRLIIREAKVPEVGQESFQFVKWTSNKYYEVCTDPELYEYVRAKGDG